MANELKKKLESQIDAIADGSAPAISDFQASDFINQAIRHMLNMMRLQGFEKDDYNRNFIAPLKKSGNGTIASDQSGVHNNGQFWDLPEDFYHMLQEEIEVDVRDCFTSKLIIGDVLPVGEDYIMANWKNPQKKPSVDPAGNAAFVWRLSFGRNEDTKISELITDGTFNITKYKFRYLSVPTKVVIDLTNPENQVDTNIYEDYYDDIINKAAIIALENMRMISRFQSKEYLNKEQGL